MTKDESFVDSLFLRQEHIGKAHRFRANIREHVNALETLERDAPTVWLLRQLDSVIVGLLSELGEKTR